MNVSYEYYKDSFGGSLIPESRWNSLEIKMSARLNRYTFDTGKSLDSMLYEIAEVYLVNTGLMSLVVDDNVDECDDYNL